MPRAKRYGVEEPPDKLSDRQRRSRLWPVPEMSSEEGAVEEIVLHCPVAKVRRGHALRLILPPSTPAVPLRQRDEKLLQLVAEAHAARKLVLENPGRAVASIAVDHGRCRKAVARDLIGGCTMDFVSIDSLREHGFEGFLTVAELAEGLRASIKMNSLSSCPQRM